MSESRDGLTPRELAVMQVFWKAEETGEELTAEAARARLCQSDCDLAYVTVANVVRGLHEKGFLRATNDRRPFTYTVTHDFQSVAGSMVRRFVDSLFGGSREEMLVQLLRGRKLSARERAVLKEFLDR
jgi:BlaI family transcriptional regulator, penicillinase repressor